jgi:alpha-tubulin suppressor-like RCC1 family protein
VQIGTGTTWKSPISARNYAYATKTDGTLWGWGYNTDGQINPDKVVRSSPIQIGALTNWNMVASSFYSTIATKTDGTLWTWGRGGQGEMGINVAGITGYRSSPVQVGTDTNWYWVAQGQQRMAAIKTNGTLWTWGNNGVGNLGINSIINRSSPTQVGTDTNWSKVSIFDSVVAIKTDGTLWGWGPNNLGQVGDNSGLNRSSPVQIGTGTTWRETSKFYSYGAAALKTDGTAWVWGFNQGGELGENIPVGTAVGSPVQFTADTNWSKLPEGQFSYLLMIKSP